MYKIGEFSMLSKTTIKALRYYEKEGLLKPCAVDKFTGYRYYETNQLEDVARIVSLREIGLSIKRIKKVLNGENLTDILENREKEIKSSIELYNRQLLQIKKILKENRMKESIFIKDIPSCTVYYKDGIIGSFGDIMNFVLSAGEECIKNNPGLKCTTPEYCFVSYLDGEYREKDMKIRYAEAVETVGKESENVKFMQIPPITAVCISHKGSYSGLRKSYNAIMKYIEENDYEIADLPRECYIDGCWNKEKEEDYITEIQVPVK